MTLPFEKKATGNGPYRSYFCRNSLLIIILTTSNLFGFEANAQELPSPWYQTNQFNSSIIFRQDVCHIQVEIDKGGRSIENALDGFKLRTVNAISQYFCLNEETGGLDENYPGLTAVLLDELAKRAGFTWRNSFAVTEGPIEGKTWTELLQWTTNVYDVSVDWWALSTMRMALGISFPESWYDASIIMVARKSTGESKFDAWSWTVPFDASVWVMIVVTVVFSGLVYWFMERIDKKSDRRSLEDQPVESLYLAAIAFTRNFEFHPRTNPARLFALSLSFWTMLAAAAYTANLASFLVVQNTPELQINSVADAVRSGVRICVLGSTQADEALTKNYPNAIVVRKELESDIFKGVMDEDCVIAVTTVSSWQFWERDAEVNGACELYWIGRTFRPVPAGFATATDAGNLCTSLIKDVLDVHFMRMREEGFLEEAWDRHLERTATIDCEDPNLSTSEGNKNIVQLNMKNMGGIFLLHYALSIIAIAYALVYRFAGYMEKRDKRMEEEEMRQTVERINNKRKLMARQSSSRNLFEGINMDDDNVEEDIDAGKRHLPKRGLLGRLSLRNSREQTGTLDRFNETNSINGGDCAWSDNDKNEEDEDTEDISIEQMALERKVKRTYSRQDKQTIAMEGDIKEIKKQLSVLMKLVMDKKS